MPAEAPYSTAASTFDEVPAVAAAEPVLAEVVDPPPPADFRFGLRSMLLVMAACSIQFAVMNWVGIFVGLVVTTTIFTIVFAAVFGWAVLASKRNPAAERRLDQIGIRLVIAIAIVGVAACVTGYAIPVIHLTRAAIIRARVQDDLGLTTREIVVRDQDQIVAGLEIRHVRPGSVADQAGLRIDDVILPPRTCDEWFEQIQSRRGKQTIIHGASGAATAPVEKCPAFDLSLTIPD